MKIVNTSRALLIALSAALEITGTSAFADFVVAPGANATAEGGSRNRLPFVTGSSLSTRYQQVYASTEFSSLNGPLLISAIEFRPDASIGGAFSTTITNVQIALSTTSRAPDALSGTFATNVGADDVVVFAGALALSSGYTGPASGPKDFDIRINLTTPFLFDPSVGNLLLDVRNFSGSGPTAFFDAVDTAGDSVSRVYDEGGAGGTDTLGLVTRFTATPAPEPSAYALLAFICAGLLSLRRRRSDPPTPRRPSAS